MIKNGEKKIDDIINYSFVLNFYIYIFNVRAFYNKFSNFNEIKGVNHDTRK